MQREKVVDIYSTWFENPGYNDDTFTQRYGLNIDSDDITHEYEFHKRWTSDNNVHLTPCVIINNHALPSIYKIEDLEELDEL